MKELVATLTERGQVTIPSEVRDLLGLKPRDQVVFAIDDGQVRLKPVRFTLDSTFQSVPSLPAGVEIDDTIGIANDERAARDARKMRCG
ncbi:MAG: AbrB/MazE/SpoVT family DNA-binding domain-containing protein [Dehalococcoidia bacterium]